MALSTARPMTAAEFSTLPEQSHTELIDGEIVVNQPSICHQRIVGWLHARLLWFAEANPGVGEPGLEADTPIDEHNVFVPDVPCSTADPPAEDQVPPWSSQWSA